MSSNSTKSPRSSKAAKDRPKKPYADFPLSPHASGKWQKKIRGEIHYFGTWAKRVNGKLVRVDGDGWKEALELYKAQAEDLHAGRIPRAKCDAGLTLKALCDEFLTAKLRRVGLPDDAIKQLAELEKKNWLSFILARVGAGASARRISPRMCLEYKATTDRLIKHFGKGRLVEDLMPSDFASLAKELEAQYGPTRRGNEIQKVRTVFKFAFDNKHIKSPVTFGTEFSKPDRTELRKHRALNGEKTLKADEIRRMLSGATVQLKAMLLLGINAAFGNHDCATLPLSALNLEDGWINHPRPKTGISRRCPLWRETVAALREVIAERPDPSQEGAGELVFITSRGRSWLVNGIANPVSLAARNLMKTKKVGIHREGIGFYTLRHTFRTVADATKDPNAIRLIMGHTDNSIDANYTHGIDDSRLLAVTDHVRRWLLGSPDKGKSPNPNHETNWAEASKSMVMEDAHGNVVHKGEYVRDKITEPENRPSLRLYVG